MKDAVFDLKESLINSSMWSSRMDTVYYGLCHTFLYPGRVSNQGFFFALHQNLREASTFISFIYYFLSSN